MPPATITSALPAASMSWAKIAACMPDPQTLLTVVASTDWGRPAPERRLARRGLAEAGGKHAAHEDLLDRVGGDAGALDRGADRRGAELGGGCAGQRALERAHRGAGVGQDDDRVGGSRYVPKPVRPERGSEGEAPRFSGRPRPARDERMLCSAHRREARLVQVSRALLAAIATGETTWTTGSISTSARMRR